jgi:hypothetical protein
MLENERWKGHLKTTRRVKSVVCKRVGRAAHYFSSESKEM